MDYISTRAELETQIDWPVTRLDDALSAGLAPDGGLYVPTNIPTLNTASLEYSAALPTLAKALLQPFFEASRLVESLPSICDEALNQPLPIVPLSGDDAAWILELFHGPTAAFKDFAARFLAGCLAALQRRSQTHQTVLVATSGDTGAAVASAFHLRPGFSVVILYPDGKVSPRQAHQLGAFGGNVRCYRVQGTFDHCQALAKQALRDHELVRAIGLTSANSISIGRLLPQITYYAYAALKLGKPDAPLNVIVPTGNLGNALACVLAREMGMPIGRIVLATNANRTLADFFQDRTYRGRPGLATLANAMDVGDPSNFERLAWLFRQRDLHRANLLAESIDDQTIRQSIERVFLESDYVVCPHTACAMELLHRFRQQGDQQRWMVAATAHPAKFESIVEDVIGRPVPPPLALAELLTRPSHAEPIPADYQALRSLLLATIHSS